MDSKDVLAVVASFAVLALERPILNIKEDGWKDSEVEKSDITPQVLRLVHLGPGTASLFSRNTHCLEVDQS